MRKGIGCVLLLLALLVVAKAQSPSEEPILEVYRAGTGMVSIDIAGKSLFLRVHASGSVEFEEFVENSVGRNFIKREYQLGGLELESLKSLLRDVLAAAPPREFEPDAVPIDHVIEEDIRITIGSKTRSIRLVNFAPSLSRDREKYPMKVLELECSIRAMRAKKAFRMLGDDCILTR